MNKPFDNNATREISPALSKSPLASLPREIRDEIYAFALHSRDGIAINVGGQQPRLRSSQPFGFPLALTNVCNQIREECLSIFYSSNTFRFIPLAGDPRLCETLQVWLDLIGAANRNQIQNVDIELGFWSPGYSRPSSVTRFATPLPIQAAAYRSFLQDLSINCTFSINVGYSDVPGLGSFRLCQVDLVDEEKVYATPDSRFEQACLRQAKRIEDASADSKIEGYAVIRLMMGLERCRNSFAEFLSSFRRELAVRRAIRQANSLKEW